ncbi:hypothetical protein BH23GEM9_BH23GEM9_13540 [soil metagenome]
MHKTRQTAPPELDRLEQTIHRLLESHDAWRQRATAAESRIAELEGTVRQFASGGLDPVALADQVRALEERNRAMKERLERGQETVQRMLARLQFAEEGR